jgi:hypothetical protein
MKQTFVTLPFAAIVHYLERDIMEWYAISWEGWFLLSDQSPSLAEFQTKTSSIPVSLVANALLLVRISAVWQQLLLNAEPKYRKYFSVCLLQDDSKQSR